MFFILFSVSHFASLLKIVFNNDFLFKFIISMVIGCGVALDFIRYRLKVFATYQLCTTNNWKTIIIIIEYLLFTRQCRMQSSSDSFFAWLERITFLNLCNNEYCFEQFQFQLV